MPEDIIRAASKNLGVRDGWASLYFHPFLETKLLSDSVEGIKGLGFDFVKASLGGLPMVAGAAMVGGGGFVVADLWWRERTVDDLAAGTGRAAVVHRLGTATPARAPTDAGDPRTQPDSPAIRRSDPAGERSQSAEQEFPLPSPPDPDAVDDWVTDADVIGAVAMGSIGLNAPIVEVDLVTKDGQVAWQVATNAVGHHLGTALPGERGNAVFSGHISSRGAGDVFRHLPDLAIGDALSVDLGGLHYYTVTDKLVVEPSEAWVMAPTDTPIATFITCVPDGVYSQRLVVVAEPLA
jgi:sortase A